jgi:hypothetical protein
MGGLQILLTKLIGDHQFYAKHTQCPKKRNRLNDGITNIPKQCRLLDVGFFRNTRVLACDFSKK